MKLPPVNRTDATCRINNSAYPVGLPLPARCRPE
jgi:hypothetical protein